MLKKITTTKNHLLKSAIRYRKAVGTCPGARGGGLAVVVWRWVGVKLWWCGAETELKMGCCATLCVIHEVLWVHFEMTTRVPMF
jgi:hypothetical protein